MINRILWCSVIILLLFNGCMMEKDDSVKSQNQLFKLVDSEVSNVHFINELYEGLNANILMYEYFYNGGGVAVGDVNNDGFQDIYFSSNMGPNKLYLNTGVIENDRVKLVYSDVSSESGVEGNMGPWKTGVSMVDINSDGLLDIFVAYSGALPPDKRENQVFINQGLNDEGIPSFIDQAPELGLNSSAFSNQHYFLDYDMDGDLDVLLLNHNPKNLPMLNEAQTKELISTDAPLMGTRLFENKGEIFEDVTLIANIESSPLSYGLGIAISDFNNDGWPDFYISNDYNVPDKYYINNKDKTFKNALEESFGHISHFSMGNDAADINSDGYMDLFTLDMLPEDNKRQKLLLSPDNYSKYDLNLRSGFYHQNMRNMLQLNNGNGSFTEIGQLSGISNTDWSWSALFADYDNDSNLDLLVTNGYRRDYTNLDYINFMDDFVEDKGRLKREDVVEMVHEMPASDVQNYMFSSSESPGFKDVTKKWGLDHVANSNGAAYVDLDNDGDLDLVMNNIDKEAFLFENVSKETGNYLSVKLKGESSKNPNAIGARVTCFIRGKKLVREYYPVRGYQSSVSHHLHFGLGESGIVDSLFVQWPGGNVDLFQNLEVNKIHTLTEGGSKFEGSIARTEFQHFEKSKNLFDHKHPRLEYRDFDRQELMLKNISNGGPIFKKVDLNNDQQDELIIGGAKNQTLKIFTKNGLKEIGVPDIIADAEMEDSAIEVIDVNNDGLPDLFVSSGGYWDYRAEDPLLKDRLYLNEGNYEFKKAQIDFASTATSCSAATQNGKNTYLFTGGGVVPGKFPLTSKSLIYTLSYDDERLTLSTIEIPIDGIPMDARWEDLNKDGRDELLVTGHFMGLQIIEWDGKEFSAYEDGPNIQNGFWNTIELSDLNGDGLDDIILGNLGKNTQIQVNENEPFRIVYKDFDQNGSIDPIMNYYIQGESYPFMTRDELCKQLTRFNAVYPNYESFADVTSQELLKEFDTKDATTLDVFTNESIVLLSSTDGTFKEIKLPLEAQYSSIHVIHILDFNNDGNSDLILGGNDTHLKLQLGKLDANYGQLFEGNGDGTFKFIPQNLSGFDLRGDVRSILEWDGNLVIGINEGKVEFWKQQRNAF